MTKLERNKILTYILLVIMGIIFSIIFYFAPHYGDDMGYGHSIEAFSGKFGGNEILTWAYYNVRHWFFTNGRMANFLAAGVLYWFPQWLIALFDGFMQAYLGFIILKISRLWGNHLLGSILVLSFTWLALPWWDSGLLTDVAINYTWSVDFGLTVVFFVLKTERFTYPDIRVPLIMIFAFVAGMMHEAMSVPILAGFLTLYLIKRFSKGKISLIAFNASQKKILISMAIGGVFVITSPGIWRRFFLTTSGLPDDPFPLLFLKSDFLIIILFLVIIFILSKEGRDLRKYYERPGVILFIVASFCSAFFSGISGIVGRSGFFAQIYSLIALTLLIEDKVKVWPRFASLPAGLVFVASILFCYINVMIWQIKRGREFNEVKKLYLESADGVVFYDYTRSKDVPFYTLGITKGVLSPEQTYPILMLQDYEGAGKPYKILPESLKSFSFKDKKDNSNERKGYISLIDPTNHTNISEGYLNDYVLNLYQKGDSVFTVTSFERNGTSFYYVEPLILEYGDRIHFFLE